MQREINTYLYRHTNKILLSLFVLETYKMILIFLIIFCGMLLFRRNCYACILKKYNFLHQKLFVLHFMFDLIMLSLVISYVLENETFLMSFLSYRDIFYVINFFFSLF